MKKIFFLGGVHGAGKGQVSKYISNSLDIESISASDLLRWTEISESAGNKKVENISFTQKRLISGLNRLETGNYLIDGHFCLLDSNGDVNKISIDIFKSINPRSLAVMITDPIVISERLLLRDKQEYGIELIRNMQKAELNHAISISNELKTPLTVIENGILDGYLEVVSNLIKH